jgi:GT2 family glycosyltransferase
MTPALSVVIPVYNNWWLTARCLRELEQLRDAGTIAFETIVVDNASTDETPYAIREYPSVRYLRHEKNENFAGACNAGARMAQAPVMLLLNNDAYPVGDAFTPLVRAFERDEVAIAGGALFFEDGVTQAAGLVVLPNAHWHYFYRNLPPDLDAVRRSRDALAVSGAAMAVRTAWFLENGGFDESFVNGFEDVDLCLRAREQRRLIEYVAHARFAHYEAASEGRFDREAENERRFYARWLSGMESLPRTLRGDVGAIVVRNGAPRDSLLGAALVTLEAALRAFGHPIVRDGIPVWRRFDRRFRRAASLSWFGSEPLPPSISIGRRDGMPASIRADGAATVEVAWLPCVGPERAQRLRVRRSDDAACTRVGVVGGSLDGAVRITPEMLLGDRESEFACVVHLGRTDDAAFGNVLLAQAGLPAVALDTGELRALFADDVAMICSGDEIAHLVARMVEDTKLRSHYGRLVAADSVRRFSPRRSAIRVVDLLCAARFGLERPARAHCDTPR